MSLEENSMFQERIVKIGLVGRGKKIDKAIERFKEICEWDVKLIRLEDIDRDLIRECDFSICFGKGADEDKLLDALREEGIPIVFVDAERVPSFSVLEVREESPETIATLFYVLFRNRALRRYIVERQGKREGIRFQIEGSFDSSYSLAVVNRNLSLALEGIFPGEVSLFSTDGYGDFDPRKDFLEKNPKVKELWMRGVKNLHADVVLRNPYPPRVADMKGLINGLASYGWEESEYLKEYLDDFERSFDFVCVMSPYVKKVLEDNGITIPVFFAGLGTDHIKKIESKPYPLKTKKKFKFFHVSSCFPRKGVDLLLSAYVETFSKEDDVVLIIKTFPNPHHYIEKMVEEAVSKNPSPPEVEIINEDIEDEVLKWLYEISDVVVFPSRGEGFLLPAGEAMQLKKPVITTAFGGQTLFCRNDTAWLLPFRLEKAKTHFDLPFSYWAEPDKEELKRLIRWFYYKEGRDEEIKKKVDRAYEVVSELTWDRVAKNVLNAIDKVKTFPIFKERPIRVALISSWNSRCGIAGYSGRLVKNFSEDLEVYVFANLIPKEEIIDERLEKRVKRLWTRLEKEEEAKRIITEIAESKAKVVLIQHHYSFFEVNTLRTLLLDLLDSGKEIFMTIHCLRTDNEKESLKRISDVLSRIRRVLVHSLEDVNTLLEWGVPWEKICLFPHGIEVREIDEKVRKKMKKRLGMKGKIVIGSFGFLRPHKGIKELIMAFKELIEKGIEGRLQKEIHLFLANSLYPSEDSISEFNNVKELIAELGLERRISLKTDFIPEEKIPDYLSVMDVCVFPYQETEESSSAAVREAIGMGLKVVCTPFKIFQDVEEVVYFSKGYSPSDLAEKIEEVLTMDEKEDEERIRRLNKFLEAANWKAVSKRLENMIKYSADYK